MHRPILTALALAIAATAAHAEVYRWVDEEGNVHYGDRIPPKYSRGQTERLNTRGVVVESQEAELTAEDLEERAEAERRAEQEREEAEKQAAYDRFLMTTYETRDDLIAAHTTRLNLLDSRIKVGEASVGESESALSSLKARAEKESGKKKERTEKQIRQFEVALTKGRSALDAMKHERERIVAEHERDLTRYDALRSESRRAP